MTSLLTRLIVYNDSRRALPFILLEDLPGVRSDEGRKVGRMLYSLELIPNIGAKCRGANDGRLGEEHKSFEAVLH